MWWCVERLLRNKSSPSAKTEPSAAKQGGQKVSATLCLGSGSIKVGHSSVWVEAGRAESRVRGVTASLVTARNQTCTLEPGRSCGRWVQPEPEWATQWGLQSLRGFHPEAGEQLGRRLACWLDLYPLSGPAGCAVEHDAAGGWEGDQCWGLQGPGVPLPLWW